MKYLVLFLVFTFSINVINAQRIRINGDIKTKTEIPIPGVLVMAFDHSTLLKSYVSDEKGEYSFNVDNILYYKPGMHAHTYSLNNRLDKETQGMYVYIQMDDSLAETAIELSVWLKSHRLTQSYMDSIYTEEIRKLPPPSKKKVHKSKKDIQKEALAEQQRFSNYKKTTEKKSVDNQEREVTTILIGPDIYELISSPRGDKKYFKNQKPITETTYRFETTRRYDGVLKKSKNVKKFDKYHPQEHVRG
jgi:hypothetical protein